MKKNVRLFLALLSFASMAWAQETESNALKKNPERWQAGKEMALEYNPAQTVLKGEKSIQPFDWHSWLRPVDPNALSAARVLAARSRPCPFRIAAGRHFPALRSVYDERHLSILPLCPVLSEVIS